MGDPVLSHLCPAVDPVLVQPHIPDSPPHPPPPPPPTAVLHYQVFGSVLIRLPRCCLHSSPSRSSSSQTPHHIQEAAPGPQTENRLPCHLPPSAFPAPPPLGVQLCWLCGVLSHPVYLCTLVPLSQSQEQCTGYKRKVGPAVPSGSSRGRWCLLSSHSPSRCP